LRKDPLGIYTLSPAYRFKLGCQTAIHKELGTSDERSLIAGQGRCIANILRVPMRFITCLCSTERCWAGSSATEEVLNQRRQPSQGNGINSNGRASHSHVESKR